MNLLEELRREKNNIFQFYIVVGDGEKNRKIISDFLEKELNLNLKDNFYFKKGDDFLIDEARKIKKENSLSNGSDKKIFFLDFQKISLESQNALLKTFEDVGENSNFFLFVPSSDFLLDTIKSRGRILEGDKIFDFDLAEKFFNGSWVKREKIILKVDKSNISIFMDSLEDLILKNKKIDLEFYKKFLELKKYIFDKGVSLKNILTWIGLNLD